MTGANQKETSEVSSASDQQSSASVIHSVAESHSLQITQHKLNGGNFLEWSQSVLMVIQGKGRLEYLTGEAKAPEKGSAGYKTWASENSMAKAWLVNSMEPRIGRTSLYYKTAKEIWDMAQEIYSDLGNTAQVFELKSALKERKQGDLSVTQYFNDLTNPWQELDLFQEVKWNCAEDGQKYKQMMEKEGAFDFLHGLNKELDKVRGRVLGFKPFPGIREAFAEVRREEARKRVMLGGTSATLKDSAQNSAPVTKQNFPQYNGDQRGFRRNEWPWCDNCQPPGHTKKICWKLHGRPANWKPRRQADGRSFQVITEEEKTEKGGSAFSKEQMEQLQAMFNQTQVQSMAQTIPNCSLAQTDDYQSAFTIKSETKSPWIIDSGALIT